MRPFAASVVHGEPSIGGLSRLTIAAESLRAMQPGQWIALHRPEWRTVVAQPFAPAAIDTVAGSVDVLYPAGSPLATSLALLPDGAAIQALGPWGRPFHRDVLARHAVLVGSGARLAGLLALARSLVDDGVAVAVLHDATTAAELMPPALLPAAAELHVATLDGSAGAMGPALDLLPPLLQWADVLYAALPPGAYVALRDLVRRHRLRPRRGFASVLAEAPLGCYAGACDGCAVRLRNGYGLLCRDGPAFDLLDMV